MFYLGVDGGGTKTAFTIVNQRGEILAHTEQETSYIDQVGIETVKLVLETGAQEVCTAVGITLKNLTYSFWGLPGFGENLDYVPLLEQIIYSILETDRFRCGNDVEVGWAGSLACQPGIHLVAGTGAIGYGVDQNGSTARSSGWGEVFGDEGSAYWLGKRILGIFSKQTDGRLPRTPLYEILKRQLNLERDLDLIPWANNQGRNQIATLATTVHEAARLGDPFAIELFEKSAYEHSLTVKSLIAQLDFPDNLPIPVSYSGGVFKAGDLILEPLKNYLKADSVRLQEPLLSPAVGSCLLSLQMGGIDITEELIHHLQRQEEGFANQDQESY